MGSADGGVGHTVKTERGRKALVAEPPFNCHHGRGSGAVLRVMPGRTRCVGRVCSLCLSNSNCHGVTACLARRKTSAPSVVRHRHRVRRNELSGERMTSG